MSHAQPKAIVFDVDGVLIHVVSASGSFLWQENIEADLRIPHPVMQAFFANHWRQIGTGQSDTIALMQQHLISHGLSNNAEDVVRYWLENDARLDHDMLQAAGILRSKGYRLYLGTNQERCRANYLWETLLFKERFEAIFASCFIGHEKPDPAYFAAVQKKTGVNPSELLFIDDTLTHVKAARTCGWQSYHHRDFSQTRRDLFEHL